MPRQGLEYQTYLVKRSLASYTLSRSTLSQVAASSVASWRGYDGE